MRAMPDFGDDMEAMERWERAEVKRVGLTWNQYMRNAPGAD